MGALFSSPLGSASGVPGLDHPHPHCGLPGAQSQDCIAAALACSKILKELSKEEEDTDSLEEMLALADEYEHRAIGGFTSGGLGPWPLLTCPPGSSSLACPGRVVCWGSSLRPSPASGPGTPRP